MPGILYILTKTGQSEKEDFLNYIQQESDKDSCHSTIVFSEDQLDQQGISSENMYIIQQDKKTTVKETKLTPISYRDLLGMIFFSDCVSVL